MEMAGKTFRSVFWATLVILLAVGSTARADPLKSVAKELAKGAKKMEIKRVAVLLFPYQDGGLSSGSSIVSDRLMVLLAKRKGFQVIERSHLANLLQEMRLEESGATSPEGAQKPGGILAADAVITGTLVDHEEADTEVYARLIRTETGVVLAAASAHIERTWEDSPSQPPDVTETEEPEYVMHASALIPTPWARGGRVVRTEPTEVAWASNPGTPSQAFQNEASQASFASGGPTSSQPIPMQVGGPVTKPPTYSPEQAQFLYALGATLDSQGQSTQAARVYRRLIRQSPEHSMYHRPAMRRLAAEGRR